MAPLRGALLAYPHTRPPFQTTIARAGFQATRLDTNQLQTTDNSLVPNRLLEWYPRRCYRQARESEVLVALIW